MAQQYYYQQPGAYGGAVAMDVLLSALRPAIQGRAALCDSSYRGSITADGYVPGTRGDGRLSAREDRHHSGQLQRNDGAEGSPVSLGLTLANLGLQFAGFATVLYMSARMTQYMLQLKERESQQAARSLLRAKLPARRDIDMDSLYLNAHEISVAMDVVASSSLVTTFDMIGGLGDMKQEIMDIVTLACSREAQLQGVTAPRGMLLSGVPGTGKTMLAQAIAKQSGATFINVRMGAVQQKYVGEGEKMVAAIFSLANKLAPSIIFIDEIDCCLRTRTGFEHDHVLRVKTEFMTLWDGLLTERSRPVMVLGTTNRPGDVDPAILRRLPRQFVVALPETAEQREHILRLIARKYKLAEGVDLRGVAEQTAGFSGSDLDALFQAAQTVPAREFARALRVEMRARALTRVIIATPPIETAAPPAATEPSPLRRSIDNAMSLLRDANREMTRLFGEVGGGEGGPALQAADAEAAAEAAEGGAAAEASITRAQIRPISEADFAAALRNVRPTGHMAMGFELNRATQRRPHEQ